MAVLLRTVWKRAGWTARCALHGARVILCSPNLPICLVLAASMGCALAFTFLAALWWEDMDFIAGGRRDVALRKNHLRQVQRTFAQIRFLSAKIWTKQKGKRHGKYRRVFQAMDTDGGDMEGLFSEAGIPKIRTLDDPDADGDGLLDSEEIALGTNPSLRDSDGDGLWDGTEIKLGLDPNAVDSEGDGVKDGDRDGDGDGYSNIAEQRAGYDPGLKNSSPVAGPCQIGYGACADGSLLCGSFIYDGRPVAKRRYAKKVLSPTQSPPSGTPASTSPARRKR